MVRIAARHEPFVQSQRAISVAVAVIAALALGGCSSLLVREPTPAELAGQYRHDGPGKLESTLELEEAGTFVLAGVPRTVVELPVAGVEDDPDWGDVETVAGTWVIDPSGEIASLLAANQCHKPLTVAVGAAVCDTKRRRTPAGWGAPAAPRPRS